MADVLVRHGSIARPFEDAITVACRSAPTGNPRPIIGKYRTNKKTGDQIIPGYNKSSIYYSLFATHRFLLQQRHTRNRPRIRSLKYGKIDAAGPGRGINRYPMSAGLEFAIGNGAAHPTEDVEN